MPLPNHSPNPWAEFLFAKFGKPSAQTAGRMLPVQRLANRQATGSAPVASIKRVLTPAPAGNTRNPRKPDYWETRHEPVECLDARDCQAQLTARREARDWHNGPKSKWEALIMKGAFDDNGTIRRPGVVEKNWRQPKVLRDHDQWCQDMGVDVTNSLWARPDILKGRGEGMSHKSYDEQLRYELEHMKAFDDNKVPGRSAATMITKVPLSVAPKFAKGSGLYKKTVDIFGKYLKDSPTEMEQLDAVRLLADYHAICEREGWGR